jgi:hypothetical protein
MADQETEEGIEEKGEGMLRAAGKWDKHLWTMGFGGKSLTQHPKRD